eukprot:CAMPEP_0197306118 /NCGR_PEP_ID=MMETSP0891-20130614/2687_1 /TAXON_ID=44058 ORGANISM="Aureoumbra lagunensis, Strain CCMP1510" /NCGR_SAMPLE_ID=MMETSP0891 /ASSEMBLY_ACC=CAM_ASM_000534 /LENGTH=235 /DNA_ID=CAMNT_0042787961 /DNA_START=237 /DNA_END=944 /DNA_ORIENTATION=-
MMGEKPIMEKSTVAVSYHTDEIHELLINDQSKRSFHVTSNNKENDQCEKSVKFEPQKWEAWEDTRLIVAAHRYARCQWRFIAKEIGHHRNHMQCLQRWKSIVEPALMDEAFTEADGELIRSEVQSILKTNGGTISKLNWKEIAALLPFRSGPAVEEYWYNELADAPLTLTHYSKANAVSSIRLAFPNFRNPNDLTLSHLVVIPPNSNDDDSPSSSCPDNPHSYTLPTKRRRKERN